LKGLLSENVEGLIGITLQETPIKPELIVQVDLGPFKYNQDHGAPIRKAAFVLLENMTEKFTFNQSDVVDAVINGFQDSNEDVQQQCLRFMNRFLVICPNIVMSKLDRLVEKMQYIYTKNSNNLKAKNDG
jgi:cullin-associated NEDD8-dissociated protein 1